MCVSGVSTLSQEGEKLRMGERMGCTGWCRWTVQPLWHQKRTDAQSSSHLVWCVRMWVLKDTVLPYCNRVCSALLRVTESLQIARSWWKWQIYLLILCGHRVNLIKPGGFQSAIKANWWNVLNYTPPIFLWFCPPHPRDRILEHINWWNVPQSPRKDGRTSGLFTFSHKYHSSSLWGKSLF